MWYNKNQICQKSGKLDSPVQRAQGVLDTVAWSSMDGKESGLNGPLLWFGSTERPQITKKGN